MVNLLITMRCNRSCSFCFAKEKRDVYSKPGKIIDISEENVEKVLSFLAKSRCEIIQIAGGEPTLHPKFEEIVKKTLESMRANILSNCMWDSKLNDFFDEISPNSLGFLLNIDHPKRYNPSEWDKVEENLSFLSKRENITLSFNIFEKEPDYHYVFDLASKYHFKNLRLSFSMPVNYQGNKNTYLNIDEYKYASVAVMEFVKTAEALGANVGIDNALPICMFTSEDLFELILKKVISPERNFVCYPAIDIGPDLSVWRCFGTSKLFNKKLDDFNSLDQVYEYYQRVSRLYQFKFFQMEKCYKCNYADQERCQGGCIGFAEMKSEDQGVLVKEITDQEILKAKLKLSTKFTSQNYRYPQEITSIKLENGSTIEVPSSLGKLFPLFNGRQTTVEILGKSMPNFDAKEDRLSEILIEMVIQQTIPYIRNLLECNVLLQ